MDATRICETCGNLIPRNPKWRKAYYATRRFCDRRCQFANQPDITRDYIVTNAGCWEWQGRLDKNGYGKAYAPHAKSRQTVDWAHRSSYRLHVGPIPDGLELDHLCVNPPCINPEHLEPVTRAVNVRRAFERRGHHDRQALAAALRASGLKYQEIADAIGVDDRKAAHQLVQRAISNDLVAADALPRTQTLTEADHEDIRRMRARGSTVNEIAARYSIHPAHASRVSRGIRSGHGRKAAA